MSWDNGLTNEQRRAASHSGTPARLLAGPGTGKTLTLTRRVVYLVNEKNVEPGDILVLTFTRAAAAELRKRTADELGERAKGLFIMTLHSYALSVILRYGAGNRLPTPIRIADDYEERHIIEEDLKDILKLNSVNEARDLLNQLSADWEQGVDNPGHRSPNPRFMGAWEEHRRIFGYTLRAELVYQLKQALQEEAIRIERLPQYILVDEYQDFNPCDLAVIKKIAELRAEPYVAGDDDQSIYGFRYADPEGIRRFKADYKSAISFDLQICQRCGESILRLAEHVVKQDTRRVDKTLKPAKGAPSGEVRILHFSDQFKEAKGIALICRWLVNNRNVKPEDILVLLRSDRNQAFSQPIRGELENQGLPVRNVANPLEPLNETEGREFLSILRLLVNEKDHLAWRTLLQIRRNQIGDKTLKDLYELARERGDRFTKALSAVADDPNSLERGLALAREVENIKQKVIGAKEIIQNNVITVALEQLAEKYIKDDGLRQSIIGLFKRVIEAVAEPDLGGLLRALYVSLENAEQEQESDAINIMTMHQAKGLTAEAVFIAAAEDEYIPGRSKGRVIDDERRLLYVSLTRARRYLYVTHCQKRTGQQRYTGRNTESRRRNLTRFLSGGPIVSEDGQGYIRELTE